MTQFAKLYERADGQVLVVKERDPEGSPGFSVRFNTKHGNHATLSFGFDSDADRDAAFEALSEADAVGIVQHHNETSPL